MEKNQAWIVIKDVQNTSADYWGLGGNKRKNETRRAKKANSKCILLSNYVQSQHSINFSDFRIQL
jgi:hypothetical protein